MSEAASYTEEQLERDMQEQTRFFRDMFTREIFRIRGQIATDFRMPRAGWEAPYLEIAELCRRSGRDGSALAAAAERAKQALQDLSALAEDEMAALHCSIHQRLQSMENVR